MSESTQLICCAGYGGVNRSSDPTIGGLVNELVQFGLKVTLRDPIGLYIKGIDLSGFGGPNGEDCSDCWYVIRGRARFATFTTVPHANGPSSFPHETVLSLLLRRKRGDVATALARSVLLRQDCLCSLV